MDLSAPTLALLCLLETGGGGYFPPPPGPRFPRQCYLRGPGLGAERRESGTCQVRAHASTPTSPLPACGRCRGSNPTSLARVPVCPTLSLCLVALSAPVALRDPAAAPPRVPGLPRHWLPPAAHVTAPRQGPHSLASWRCGPQLADSGGGRAGGVTAALPTSSQVPWAGLWPRRGAGLSPPPDEAGAATSPPRTPSSPDGLHREFGVLRGSGARAPRRSPAPWEPPGACAGRARGPRVVSRRL